MAQAEDGKRVRLRYTCRLEDGTIVDVSDRDTLEFIVGEGDVFASLDKGVIGMSPGDVRTIIASAAEVSEFPFFQELAPASSGFPAGTVGYRGGYNIAPGEEGDVLEDFEPTPIRVDRGVSGGQNLYFDVEMLEVSDADVELHSIGEEQELR